MEKKRAFKLFGTMLLAGGILAGCNSGGGEATEEPKQEEQPAENQEQESNEQAEQSAVTEQITTYQAMMDELGKAKEDQEVDWDKVLEEYKGGLQTAVTEVNGEFDQAITAALEGGKSGDLKPNIARQLVDKTTQSYFYQKQKGLHGQVAEAMEADKSDEAKALFADIKTLAEDVFIPTAVKRDSYYELSGENSMEESINAGLSAQEEALNSGNVDDYKVYKQITDKSIYRSYYLAAQSYAEKIEKAVAEGNEEELQIMQAEGWGFYQAIKGSLSGGDEEAANKLNTLFSLNETEPASIKAAEVKDLFANAFVGKIKSYHEKVPTKLEAGEVTDARGAALEGNVFMKDIEMYLNEKLGEEKTKQAMENGEKWFEAVSNENTEEAAKYSEQIISTLNELQ
ncbi:hypothetical protein LC040_12790 [Bacillus tianshenii]|nr:hypothetical protein LC040_12790 [Bacillus tianshenii]